MKDFLKTKPDEIGKECRFVSYVEPRDRDLPDLHVVKEQIHLKNGNVVPNIKFIYDYERPFYVVNKGNRDFTQPKEWIEKEKTNEFFSTQSNLRDRAASALGMPWFKKSLKDLCAESPYLFGVDIMSTAVVKHDYFEAFPNLKTEFTVGVFDVETDMLNGTEQIMMATFSFRNICVTAVQKSFFSGVMNPEHQVEEMTKKYIGNYIEERGIRSELFIVEDEIRVLLKVFERIHEAKPDFLSIWNMVFDIGKVIEACDRANYPIEHLMSDPSVPNEYKYFDFIKGPNKKRTASGLEMPIKPAAQWHTVKCPASFYVIDAMCAYRHTRMGEQEKKSYSLDFILGEELNLSKLKFTQADHVKGASWHIFMQKNFPVEYVVYNRFDCIGMEILEDKIKDMKVVLPQFSGTSDFEDFKSQPRRKMDALHWFVQLHNRVVGCTSSALVSELDPMILSRNDWIITLAPSRVTANGLRVIEENQSQVTSIYGHVGDLDVSASYPNGEACFNISKETTVSELCYIDGIQEDVFRKQNMGISAGHVNAIDYCSTMFGMPTLFDLEEMEWN